VNKKPPIKDGWFFILHGECLVAFLNWTAMSIKEKFPLIIDEWKFLIADIFLEY